MNAPTPDAERESLADQIAAARIPILSGWRPGWYRVLAEGLAPIIADRLAPSDAGAAAAVARSRRRTSSAVSAGISVVVLDTDDAVALLAQAQAPTDAREAPSRAVIDAVLKEFPLDDLTGHVIDCGYDANDEHCGCSTLPARIAAALSATAPDAGPSAVDTCTGAGTCTALLHVHGCYADTDGTRCDDPDDHPAPNTDQDAATIYGIHLDPPRTSDAGQREESCGDCGHLATRHWLPGGCHGTQGSIARACRCARNNT